MQVDGMNSSMTDVNTTRADRGFWRGVHMADGNAQEAQSLHVRQCFIRAYKRVTAVV